jgi:hypothetical protein
MQIKCYFTLVILFASTLFSTAQKEEDDNHVLVKRGEYEFRAMLIHPGMTIYGDIKRFK